MKLSRLLHTALALGTIAFASAKNIELLNVSYDPTRELYAEYNTAFARYWKSKTGDDVKVRQSHGGSGRLRRLMARTAPRA